MISNEVVSQEDEMARTPKTDESGDVLLDDMAEAPPARPYSEAVSDEHRVLLAENGVEVDPAA